MLEPWSPKSCLVMKETRLDMKMGFNVTKFKQGGRGEVQDRRDPFIAHKNQLLARWCLAKEWRLYHTKKTRGINPVKNDPGKRGRVGRGFDPRVRPAAREGDGRRGQRTAVQK